MAIDYYQQWLGVSSSNRPPQAHELLLLPEQTSDASLINQAARAQLKRLDKYALSADHEQADASQRLMNEVAQARNSMLSKATVSESSEPSEKRSTHHLKTISLPTPSPHFSREPQRSNVATGEAGKQVRPTSSVSRRRPHQLATAPAYGQKARTSGSAGGMNFIIVGVCAALVIIVATVAAIFVLFNLPEPKPDDGDQIVEQHQGQGQEAKQKSPSSDVATDSGPTRHQPALDDPLKNEAIQPGPAQHNETSPIKTKADSDDPSADAEVSNTDSEPVLITDELKNADAELLAQLEEQLESKPFDPLLWKAMGQLITSRLTGKQVENSIGMVFIEVPPGSYLRGSPEDEIARDGDELQHRVTITQPVYASATEVTREQWYRVMGTQPWAGDKRLPQGDQLPASHVNWMDALAFCERLSEMEGKSYRLPTEAEWEYLCRAGTIEAYAFPKKQDRAEFASFMKYPGRPGTYPMSIAGSKQANAWGLHDMHGNVAEWVLDTAQHYRRQTLKDPVSFSRNRNSVLRGGSWDDIEENMRSATRRFENPDRVSGGIGFRVLLIPDTEGDPVWPMQTKILKSAQSIAKSKIRNPFAKATEKAAHDPYLVSADSNGIILRRLPVTLEMCDYKRIYVVYAKVVMVIDLKQNTSKIIQRDYLGYDTLVVLHDDLGERWIWSSSDYNLRRKLPMVIDYRGKKKDKVMTGYLYAFSEHGDDHLFFREGTYQFRYRSNDKDYATDLDLKLEGEPTEVMAVRLNDILAHVYTLNGQHQLVVCDAAGRRKRVWPLPDYINDQTPIQKMKLDHQACTFLVADSSGKKRVYRMDITNGKIEYLKDVTGFSMSHGVRVKGSRLYSYPKQYQMTHDLPIDLSVAANSYESSDFVFGSRQKGPDGFYHLKVISTKRY